MAYFGHVKLSDGELELHEIPSLDLLDCEIVILSQCDSNVSSPRYLETGNSLARAFLAAGSTRVVASFWKVNDEATAPLMSYFLEQSITAMAARQHIDYATALHAAMQRLRDEEPQWSSPYYWASFALIGPPS